MDEDSRSISWELHQSTVIGQRHGASAVDHSDLPAACVLCPGILSPDNEAGNLESIGICDDCIFLFLEEFGTPTEDTHRRRTTGVRRTRHSSSDSIENFRSQQFSDMICLARQSHPHAPHNESQIAQSDSSARFLQRTRSRTTSGSRRWRRVLSDSESDGFDSLYGESESNVSFSGYRPFQSESDAISFSGYGGDSDASVDGHSLLDSEMFNHPDAESDINSDTDIDPMHAGLSQWNSDDQEEDGEEEDNAWGEADGEENAAESSAGAQLRSSLGPSESNGHVARRRQLHSPEFEGHIRLRIGEIRETYIPGVLPFLEDSGDYLDARGFDELLERLAEADISRRGSPPAAVSFVNSLPRMVINEEHEKRDGLACAICKDFLSVGTVVNMLPCSHLYHPYCILPWLQARNSCPLCRYELPTDDKGYEEGKHNTTRSLEMHEIQRQIMSLENSSDTNDDNEADEACEFSHSRAEQAVFVNEEHFTGSSGRDSARGRWFFLAAAPFVSLVGIVLVLWLGNPQTERRRPIGHHDFPRRGQHSNPSSGSWPPNRSHDFPRRGQH